MKKTKKEEEMEQEWLKEANSFDEKAKKEIEQMDKFYTKQKNEEEKGEEEKQTDSE